MKNPLIVQNPRGLWLVTNKIHAAMGDENFKDIIPEPPDLDQPRAPKEEWTLALQGEEFHVNPMDNDDLHLIDHYRRLNDSKADPDADADAARRMVAHIMEHQAQKRQKMLMQAMTQQLAQSLGANGPQTGGLYMGGVPASLQHVQQTIEELHNPGGAGQPTQGGQPR